MWQGGYGVGARRAGGVEAPRARPLSTAIWKTERVIAEMARRVHRGEHVIQPFTRREPRLLRVSLGLFALAGLIVVLAAAWLRFLVPGRHASRVRDVTWLPVQGPSQPPPQAR